MTPESSLLKTKLTQLILEPQMSGKCRLFQGPGKGKFFQRLKDGNMLWEIHHSWFMISECGMCHAAGLQETATQQLLGPSNWRVWKKPPPILLGPSVIKYFDFAMEHLRYLNLRYLKW
jgi:hypothetical protein